MTASIQLLDEKRLSIYLNDHLAGSSIGVELSKRLLKSNPDGPLGVFLRGLVGEIEADRDVLVGIMRRLSVSEDRMKQALGRIAEKAGRLKLNGQVRGYSPLSRLVELEGLCLGVEGKLALWRSLAHVLEPDPRLEDVDLSALIARATAQRAELEGHRLEAVTPALERL